MADVGMITGPGGIKYPDDSYQTTALRGVKWVSVTDYGAVGGGVVDDTVAIQSALATGFNVTFPVGEYLVSEPLNFTTPQQMISGVGPSAGSHLSSISVSSSFNPGGGALGVFVIDGLSKGPQVTDLAFYFNQTAGTRVQSDYFYPPAVFVRDTPGSIFRSMQLVMCYVGFYLTGDVDDTLIDRLELSMMKTGIHIYDAVGHVTITDAHDFLFGISEASEPGTSRGKVRRNGSLDTDKRVEVLIVEGLAEVYVRTLFDFCGGGVWIKGLSGGGVVHPGEPKVVMDTCPMEVCRNVVMAAGRLDVLNCTLTSASEFKNAQGEGIDITVDLDWRDSPFWITGGTVTFNNCYVLLKQTAGSDDDFSTPPPLKVPGSPYFEISGNDTVVNFRNCYLLRSKSNYDILTTGTVTLSITNTYFGIASTNNARTNVFVYINSGGKLMMSGNRCRGATATQGILYIAADGLHNIKGNAFNGWTENYGGSATPPVGWTSIVYSHNN